MADLNEQNWDDDQQSQDQGVRDLPTAQPDLVGTPDSVADDLDNDPGNTNEQDIDAVGSKGGGKTAVADSTADYTGKSADAMADSDEIAENIEADEPLDNTGYEEWGYYSTEDEPLDY